MTERTVVEEWAAHGRRVERGTELSIAGERGRFRFVAHVRTAAGAEWIDVYGGPEGRAACRSFTPDRIRTVHRTRRTR
jgi:hypothetical protein